MYIFRKFLCLVLVGIISLSSLSFSFAEALREDYDLVILNGNIYNPSTDHELNGYNIAIKDSVIKRITKDDIKGKEIIDASGLVVSPGFIDLISYDPNSVGIELKVLDGVTSNLAMHGGTEDAESWYRAWASAGVITNFGASSFVTRLRWPIVGYGVDAELESQEDIDKLVESVRENIEKGALGISFSLEYVPGVKNELKPLLELANEYKVPTFYHLRYSDEERGLEGIQEVIDLGRETGAPIHIMHINSTGGTFVMDEALSMVEAASNEGLDISTCFYPYDFWATYIDSARFRPGWQDRFKITYEDLQIGGTDIRISKDTFDKYRSQHILVAAHGSMPESELISLLKNPTTMIGSDTIIEPSLNNHPRGAGTYSRVFGKYVREENVLSIMDAIKKVSYFPAKRMESAAPSMNFKGRLEVGSHADITIFNPETIIDKSTVKDTAKPSVGVEYVLVNGTLVKNPDGLIKGTRPGQPIQSYFIDDTQVDLPVEIALKTKDNLSLSPVSSYKIDGEDYVNLEELFTSLKLNYKSQKDGKIETSMGIDIFVGDSNIYLEDKVESLVSEPIIYRGGIYTSMDNLPIILKDFYRVDYKDGSLTVEPLSKSLEKNLSQDPNKEDLSSIKLPIVIMLSAILVLSGLAIYKFKYQKKRK